MNLWANFLVLCLSVAVYASKKPSHSRRAFLGARSFDNTWDESNNDVRSSNDWSDHQFAGHRGQSAHRHGSRMNPNYADFNRGSLNYGEYGYDDLNDGVDEYSHYHGGFPQHGSLNQYRPTNGDSLYQIGASRFGNLVEPIPGFLNPIQRYGYNQGIGRGARYGLTPILVPATVPHLIANRAPIGVPTNHYVSRALYYPAVQGSSISRSSSNFGNSARSVNGLQQVLIPPSSNYLIIPPNHVGYTQAGRFSQSAGSPQAILPSSTVDVSTLSSLIKLIDQANIRK